LPELAPLPSFAARPITDRALIGRVTRLPEVVIEARFASDHELYGAFLEDEPTGYGWLARRSGGIDELDFSFEVPPGNGYLWDFVTLPQARGHGVYPHLLQAIVAQAKDDILQYSPETQTRKDAEEFFMSEDFAEMTNLDGFDILCRLQDRYDENQRKKKERKAHVSGSI
jgi:GNAT superfamily N-acetyltransferase